MVAHSTLSVGETSVESTDALTRLVLFMLIFYFYTVIDWLPDGTFVRTLA